MGLFDYVRCELPLEDCPDWLTEFQTKDTPRQYMDHYRIDDEGRLWEEQYETEDRSDPNATGLTRLSGMMTRVNRRWVHLDDFDGVIDFYSSNWRELSYGLTLIRRGTGESFVRVEYRVVFVDGKLAKGPVLTRREEEPVGDRVFADRISFDAAIASEKARRRAAPEPSP